MLLLISLAKSLNTKSEVGKNKVSKEYVKRQDPTEIPSLFQYMNTWVHSKKVPAMSQANGPHQKAVMLVLILDL